VIGASRRQVVITFSVCCITAPIMGVMVGGYIIDKFGGYRGKNILNAIKIDFLFALMCFSCVYPITY